MGPVAESLDDFFYRLLCRSVEGPGGCWVWTGPVSREGYAKVTYRQRRGHVHRTAYVLFGPPFDRRLHLDHRCRNKRCWNPAHLEPVPCRTNILRGTAPAAENARKTRCKRGHELDGDNLMDLPGGRRGCRECQRMHNVNYRRRKAHRLH